MAAPETPPFAVCLFVGNSPLVRSCAGDGVMEAVAPSAVRGVGGGLGPSVGQSGGIDAELEAVFLKLHAGADQVATFAEAMLQTEVVRSQDGAVGDVEVASVSVVEFDLEMRTIIGLDLKLVFGGDVEIAVVVLDLGPEHVREVELNDVFGACLEFVTVGVGGTVRESRDRVRDCDVVAIHIQERQFTLKGCAGGVVDIANVDIFCVRGVAGQLFGVILVSDHSCGDFVAKQKIAHKHNDRNDTDEGQDGMAGLFFGFGIDGMFVHDDFPFFSAKCVDGTDSGQNKRNGLGMC